MSKNSDRTLINKAMAVAMSCTTQEQLTVAQNYCSIVYKRLDNPLKGVSAIEMSMGYALRGIILGGGSDEPN